MCSDRIANARAASLRGWRRARAREALGNVSPTRHSRRDEKKTFLLRAAPSRLSTVRFVSSRRRRRRPFTPRRRVFLPTLLVRAVSPRVVRASRASPRRFPPWRDDPAEAPISSPTRVPANPPPRRRRKCSPRASRATPIHRERRRHPPFAWSRHPSSSSSSHSSDSPSRRRRVRRDARPRPARASSRRSAGYRRGRASRPPSRPAAWRRRPPRATRLRANRGASARAADARGAG